MIKLLDKATIDKIAAGEVIEKPSSVVKELLENSIDAGSTSITVEIKEGGMSFIRVTDNGCGIPKDEVRTAYLRHATSKIEQIEDLDRIASLGFRGEALSTVAAVSQTEMITKTRDEIVGVKYVIHGGEEISFSEVGVPDGTTVVVRNLFYNTPARKKFLKSAMTEASYINDLCLKLALSHPEIAFKLIINNQSKINTSGNGNIKDTIYQLFGRDITSNLIEVDNKVNGIHIKGYIGKPFVCRGNRALEIYFVNNRYIKSNTVNRAIEEGYKTFVMQHKFPFTVLYLEMDSDKCDVNVHPTKMEFKYDNEKELFEAVTNTVRNALLNKDLIPKSKYENQNDTANNTSNNSRTYRSAEPFEKNRVMIPQASHKANVYSSTYKILEELKKADQSNKSNNIIKDEYKHENVIITTDSTEKDIYNTDEKSNSIVENINNADNNSEDVNISSNTVINVNENKNSYNTSKVNAYKQSEQIGKDLKDGKIDINDSEFDEFRNVTGTQSTLFDDGFLSKEARKKHRLIGQLFGTYWLIEYEDNLYIMDQHAAHEKVNYEKLMADFKSKEVFSQQLMPPMVISVSYAERDAILAHYDLFMKLGYDIEEFGGNEFKINAVPANLYSLHGRDMFMDFVGSLIENNGYISNDIFVRKISTMACKASVKGNSRLSFEEADALIDQLLQLENPYTCPHGRPTIIAMNKTELEKKFKRQV